jgi:hypothetical protein
MYANDGICGIEFLVCESARCQTCIHVSGRLGQTVLTCLPCDTPAPLVMLQLRRLSKSVIHIRQLTFITVIITHYTPPHCGDYAVYCAPPRCRGADTMLLFKRLIVALLVLYLVDDGYACGLPCQCGRVGGVWRAPPAPILPNCRVSYTHAGEYAPMALFACARFSAHIESSMSYISSAVIAL